MMPINNLWGLMILDEIIDKDNANTGAISGIWIEINRINKICPLCDWEMSVLSKILNKFENSSIFENNQIKTHSINLPSL